MMTFAELEAEALSVLGIHLRDATQTFAHYDTWVKLYKPRGTAQAKWAEYQHHPHGQAQQPPYRDVWHWLIDKFPTDDWIETSSNRYKDVVLTERTLDREWVRLILAPLIARHGGKIELRLNVDT